jgi:ribokinase
VAVVGSLNLDVTLVLDRLPHPGETLLAHRTLRASGGKGANQAAAAAAAGARVSMIGAVGADEAGASMIADLGCLGVDTASVIRLTGEHSGAATILLEATSAENVIIVEAGANAGLRPEGVRVAAVREAAVLLAQLETPVETVLEAALWATGKVVLNAAPYQRLPAELLERTDVLVVNQSELAGLAEVSEPATLAQTEAVLSDLAPACAVIVTAGPAGALVYQPGPTEGSAPCLTRVPALALTPLDSTGAGDCFCGVLAAWLAHGAELAQATRAAAVAASLSTLALGARAGLPDRARIERELSAQASLPQG